MRTKNQIFLAFIYICMFLCFVAFSYMQERYGQEIAAFSENLPAIIFPPQNKANYRVEK